MIIEGLFNLIYSFLNVILTPFEIVPDMPTEISYAINTFINFMFTPIRIFLFFVNVQAFRYMVPLLIVIINMEHVWDGIMWVLKKRS